jgi:hypothetical protein
VIVYHLLPEGTCDEEARYNRLQDKREERQQKRAVKALERLGYRVTLERTAYMIALRPDSQMFPPDHHVRQPPYRRA